MIHPLILWSAAFLLGVALGIAIAAFIPGWSLPARLVNVRPFRRDSAEEGRQTENAELYTRALTGDRRALDVLGARAGRISLIGQVPIGAWATKSARDHAWLLYDNAARVFATPQVSTLGQELAQRGDVDGASGAPTHISNFMIQRDGDA